jgi:two-component system response regulator
MDNLKTAVILLVEDDSADQKLIKTSLCKQKVINDLYTADNAEQALEYLQRSKNNDSQAPMPDLILLDLNMPGMGGKEFLQHIKSDDQLDTIPVVILTSSDGDKDVLESFKLQAAGYIKKPVGLDEFQEVMQRLSEYWFVICKRIAHETQHQNANNKCLVCGSSD